MCPLFICWFRHYIHCLLVYLASALTCSLIIFLTYLLPCLPFSLGVDLLHFLAGGHKRWPNLGLSCFSLFWVIVFVDARLLCVVVNLVIRVSLGLLYTAVVLSPGFDFVDWLGRASLKWPVLCRAGCKNLTSIMYLLLNLSAKEL